MSSLFRLPLIDHRQVVLHPDYQRLRHQAQLLAHTLRNLQPACESISTVLPFLFASNRNRSSPGLPDLHLRLNRFHSDIGKISARLPCRQVIKNAGP